MSFAFGPAESDDIAILADLTARARRASGVAEVPCDEISISEPDDAHGQWATCNNIRS